MVLSTNSGSRLPMDSLGIGRGCAAKAMPSIYLEVYWVYRPWPWRRWSSLCGSCHSTISVLDSNPIFQIFLQICLENELKIQGLFTFTGWTGREYVLVSQYTLFLQGSVFNNSLQALVMFWHCQYHLITASNIFILNNCTYGKLNHIYNLYYTGVLGYLLGNRVQGLQAVQD